MRCSTSRRFTLLALLAVAACAGSGCTDESDPHPVVTVESINDGEILTSDVYNNGPDALPGTDDDFILEDRVPVTVRNRPSGALLDGRGSSTAGALTIVRYEVRFSGAEGLSPLFGSMRLRVPSGETAAAEIAIIPAGYKLQPPLVELISSGEIRLEAQVVLIGEEENSGEEVSVSVTLPVHCADWADR